MARKIDPNSFRQKILEQYKLGKTPEEIMEYFHATPESCANTPRRVMDNHIPRG